MLARALRVPVQVALVAAAVFVGSAEGARASTSKMVTLRISAVVDGRSTLTISGGNARWQHFTQAVPQGPTRIGGASWTPVWPKPGENRDCGCSSNTFTRVSPPLPLSGPIGYKIVACRAVCSVTAGDGKAVLRFDDDVPPGTSTYVVDLTFARPKYELTAQLRNDPRRQIAVVGTELNFTGSGWDPRGGPITIRHDGKVIRRITEASFFRGAVKIPTFVGHECRDALTFAQGRHARQVRYRGRVSQAVAYVHGQVTADGDRRLRFNDPLCEGETAKVEHDATLAAVSLGNPESAADDSVYFGARVDAPWAGIRIHGVISTSIELAFQPGHPVLRIPTTYRPIDDAGQPDLLELQASYSRNLVIDGYSRRAGSLSAHAGITLARGVAYVDGNLALTGKLTGGGVVSVRGTTTIAGPGRWPKGKQALISGGPIVIKAR